MSLHPGSVHFRYLTEMLQSLKSGEIARFLCEGYFQLYTDRKVTRHVKHHWMRVTPGSADHPRIKEEWENFFTSLEPEPWHFWDLHIFSRL